MLADVPNEAKIMNDEPFGPVAVSRPFDTFEEVIEQANRLPYGLAAFAFTENGRRANLIGDLVESGMVGINTFAISGADTPFGGVKDSGFGSEGGKEGLESYQVVKAIHQAWSPFAGDQRDDLPQRRDADEHINDPAERGHLPKNRRDEIEFRTARRGPN